ncbi:LuxR C-terminal-related transcriptional regulator [Pseudonocardia sp. MH-G8]|uniref:LuxR C-terminal-related transcriptional regulator n=1 Tax=Pseudonocardia sp. MH-G8 TaxID=1854588 RepID=UPI000BA1466E|nr:LuxR C-terminal-related transcriptional regulator [Pseudonocardia sp. MH-G8]OZM83545.1 LuxR family transcriptional regulator [Pseudonocardia sp. MH-G8]
MHTGDRSGGRLRVPRAKTAVPRLSCRHLPRPRLLTALDAAAPDQLVLVSAPAGYGKTLLLAEWATRRPASTAWVTLDADDNDDRRFWSALLTALTSCPAVPRAHGLDALPVPGLPSRDPGFVATVLEVFEAVPGVLRLVLDDVHELVAPDPLRGLGLLVRDRPPGLQIVVAGRADPPLPVGRLRLDGKLSEVRAAELQFSVAEADAVFAAAHVLVRPDQVRRLVAQTEGWPAGLRLAAMSLHGAGDPDLFIADFVGSSRAVSDYLVGEILERLPIADREMLAANSVCDQLSASLAAALSGRSDAGEVLDALERDTALVISSGEGRMWYRVQPLLRAHLRADLQRRRPDLVTELHARAADWYAAHDQPDVALAHARLSGDASRVEPLLRQHALALVGTGQLHVVRATLDWLRTAGCDDAWQAVLAVLVELEIGEGQAALTHLQRAQDLWPVDPPPALLALHERVRSRLALAEGAADAVVLATERDGAGTTEHALVTMSQIERATALALADRRQEALPVALAAVERARELGHGLLVAQGLTVLAFIAAFEGDYRRMTELAEQADRDAPPAAEWPTTGSAAVSCMLRAYGAMLRADPAQCLALLDPVLTVATSPSGPRISHSMTATCRGVRGAALLDLGRTTEGLEQLRTARELAATVVATPELVAMLVLLEHRAAAIDGRHELARTVLAWAQRSLPDGGELALLRAERLDGLGRHEAAGEALAPLLSGSAPAVTPWALGEAYVLDCRLALLGHHPSRARRSLVRALELAEAMTVHRPLASAPAEVVDLLVHHLGSFGPVDRTAQCALDARHSLGVDRRAVALTERERTVLSLLPSQRSFDEIAQDLTVSHSTVKTHIRAIYSKLDATSRREAVDIARRDGLLQPDPGP